MSRTPWRWGVNKVGAYRDHKRLVAGCLRQSRHLPQAPPFCSGAVRHGNRWTRELGQRSRIGVLKGTAIDPPLWVALAE